VKEQRVRRWDRGVPGTGDNRTDVWIDGGRSRLEHPPAVGPDIGTGALLNDAAQGNDPAQSCIPRMHGPYRLGAPPIRRG
jgi:hypothetical protein